MKIYTHTTILNDHGLRARAVLWTSLMVVLILIGSLASAVKAETVTDENVAAKIEDAKTVADHQALEAYFAKKSAEAAKQVQLHEDMMKSYKRIGKYPGPSTWMRSHCQSLLREYRQMQADYESMAEMHGWMAEESTKE
jgi:hypothetical protein